MMSSRMTMGHYGIIENFIGWGDFYEIFGIYENENKTPFLNVGMLHPNIAVFSKKRIKWLMLTNGLTSGQISMKRSGIWDLWLLYPVVELLFLYLPKIG